MEHNDMKLAGGLFMAEEFVRHDVFDTTIHRIDQRFDSLEKRMDERFAAQGRVR